MRMRCHAQAARLSDLADVLADHAVAHAVPPLHHLPRAYAERQPVPGLRDLRRLRAILDR